MHLDETLKKLKIRLIAKDFSQMYDIDYIDTFVSIVKFDILRLFLIIVALKNLKCHQVNVNNAFTKSLLKKKIYMKSSSSENFALDQALLIRRNFYNFKQAIRD